MSTHHKQLMASQKGWKTTVNKVGFSAIFFRTALWDKWVCFCRIWGKLS